MPPPPRKKGPRTVDPAAVRSRSRGALLGLAVGDALGTTLEFKRLPAAPFPKLTEGTHTEIRGGGPFDLKKGQVTDDTQMACCLAAGLRALGRLDPGETARRYTAWMPHAFDVGNQIKAVIEAWQAGTSYELAAREVWLHSGKQAAGNGSLMRTAPIGVFFSKDSAARVKASIEDSALTHFDPRCQLACVALNGSIAAAIQSVDPPKPRALVAAASTGLSVGGAGLGPSFSENVAAVRDATENLRKDLAAAANDDPFLYGPELHLHTMQGFVRVAFRLAYWELLHAPSFEAALIDVVNRGGDADTNGAIAGALLGAAYGEEAIPERWRTAVLEALGTSRGPLADLYHPRVLLTLVES
ncbi:MAG: ADP-ribosylglycohydrolase family protein [Myxococcales bacterium]|nr:ADP-ribosylglycohydrolase family protein [Myxococcales bacterium]